MPVAKIHTLAPARARAVTPLLQHLAGDFAEVVAQVWRSPYGDFYILPAPRRHAAAIVLAGFSRTDFAPDELRRQLAYEKDSILARQLVGEYAAGFMKALAKAGEQLWRPHDYRTLLELFAEPMANEVLRHMKTVDPATFIPLSLLPAPLRLAPIVRVAGSIHAARDLGLAFQLAARMRHAGCEARLARRWSSGGDARQVFQRAAGDLTPDEFRPPSPAPRLGASFRRIVRRGELERVGQEFRNCLADHVGRIAEGRMAVYVWRAETPAAVSLNWDTAGWRLSEAKGVGNEDLDERQLRELVAILAGHGVRTGPSVETLCRRLYGHGAGDTDYYRPTEDFESQLELGDLWS